MELLVPATSPPPQRPIAEQRLHRIGLDQADAHICQSTPDRCGIAPRFGIAAQADDEALEERIDPDGQAYGPEVRLANVLTITRSYAPACARR